MTKWVVVVTAIDGTIAVAGTARGRTRDAAQEWADEHQRDDRSCQAAPIDSPTEFDLQEYDPPRPSVDRGW